MSLKNPVTLPGIDPGTIRLVAQRLNHYATPGPLVKGCKTELNLSFPQQHWLLNCTKIWSCTYVACPGIVLTLCFVRFIHLVVCLSTGPKPLPKQALHTVRSRASSFKSAYLLLSLSSCGSFLCLLPRLLSLLSRLLSFLQ